MTDDDLVEDGLGRNGYAVLSPAMNSLFESIEHRLSIRAAVRCSEFQAVLFAVYGSSYGDYHTAKAFA